MSHLVLTQISAPRCKTTFLSCCTDLVGICSMLKLKETLSGLGQSSALGKLSGLASGYRLQSRPCI